MCLYFSASLYFAPNYSVMEKEEDVRNRTEKKEWRLD